MSLPATTEALAAKIDGLRDTIAARIDGLESMLVERAKNDDAGRQLVATQLAEYKARAEEWRVSGSTIFAVAATVLTSFVASMAALFWRASP